MVIGDRSERVAGQHLIAAWRNAFGGPAEVEGSWAAESVKSRGPYKTWCSSSFGIPGCETITEVAEDTEVIEPPKKWNDVGNYVEGTQNIENAQYDYHWVHNECLLSDGMVFKRRYAAMGQIFVVVFFVLNKGGYLLRTAWAECDAFACASVRDVIVSHDQLQGGVVWRRANIVRKRAM